MSHLSFPSLPLLKVLIWVFFLHLHLTSNLYARQSRAELPFPYHPNRPGAQAYAQGGAFAASSGSVTSMLFNPAGIAQLEGRLAVACEAGWNSRTEYLPFFNFTFTSRTHPLQFAGLAIVPKPKWAVGVYYFRPTDYDLDFGTIEVTTPENPEGSGLFIEPIFERRQFGLGINLARSMSKSWHLGFGMEWRRAEIRDEISSMLAQGEANAVRFALGSIVQMRDWRLGVALQSQYKATGDAVYTAGSALVMPNFDFTVREPASARLGFASPKFFKRLRVSGDVEYQDFKGEEAIARWQFYGGTTLQLTSFLQLALGSFTFRKDYSSFVDGPRSEVFLTCGGTLKLAPLYVNASFMEGDLLNENFEGQKFFNLAVGLILP